jgi:hypothetical protein
MKRVSSAKLAEKAKSSGLAWMSIVLGGGSVLGLASMAHADAYAFNFNYDFSTISSTDMANWWTTNGTAYLHNGTDPGSPNQRLRLTPSSYNCGGSAWAAVPAGQNNVPNWYIFPQQNWSATMVGQYSYETTPSGDGMEMVFQTGGTSAIPVGADFNGSLAQQSTRLGNYLCIRLDTFQNAGESGNNDLEVFTSNGGFIFDTVLPNNCLHTSNAFSLGVTYTASSNNLGINVTNTSTGTNQNYNVPVNLGTTFGTGAAILGLAAATGADTQNQDVQSLNVSNATAIYCADYNLTASVSGGALAHGRLTQGQTCNTTAYINNSAGSAGDAMNYWGLSMWGTNGIAEGSGSGNLPYGYWGNEPGTLTASTLGLNTMYVHVDGTNNGTAGGNAAFLGNTTATVLVDALTEHVNASGMTDTGNASTTPTAFYRQNSAWGGQNLGSVTVAKQGPGSYTPAFVTGINTAVGTLSITASGADNMFGSDTSVILLGFQNVTHTGSGAALATIEGALTTYGVEWRDAFGASNNWPTLTSGLDPLASINQIPGSPDFDLELAFTGGSLTSDTSYFDFNFTGQLGTAGNVVNIAVVPEPATLSLLVLGGVGLLGRRRRRSA